jgi:hypothetical protein
VAPFLRRLGSLPAGGRAAEAALRAGGAVPVYPEGDWKGCRPLTERNVLPPLPLPAKVTVEFLRPLDWSDGGLEGAKDQAMVRSRYDHVTGLLQAGLDRLRAERPIRS